MAEVRVRDLDERVIAELKAQARRHGKTFGEEVKGVLTDAAWRPRHEWSEKLALLRGSIREKHGILPDSTPGIRVWRDGAE